MNVLIEELRNRLNSTCSMLETGVFFSLTPEEKENLLSEGKHLLEKLDAAEGGVLTVGLLGGTGVGKSSLMNALARKTIASVADRRPHTDQLLLYKHARVPLPPSLLLGKMPWREVSHTSDGIQHIVLCDLPDFDSLVKDHHLQVLTFLEHLDVLVWVTSPEKYADKRFYEFLEQVPKAKQNFYFVLNKADLFFDHPGGYEALQGAVNTFRDHIRKSSIDDPLLFVLSAQRALGGESAPPWNQFRHFSGQLFQQRDIKTVTAIKTANLDSETRRYRSFFQREAVNLNAVESILETAISEITAQQPAWLKTGGDAVALWTEKHLNVQIRNRQDDPAALIGPGYGIALVCDAWQHRLPSAVADMSLIELPDDVAAPFRRRFEWNEERLRRRAVLQHLPDALTEKIRQAVEPETLFNELKDGLIERVRWQMAKPIAASAVFFKLSQLLVYGVITALFLLAMGGETAWRHLFEAPGGPALFSVFLSIVHTLFSARGLAALGSYILLNLIVGFRFYRRYRKRRHRSARQMMESLNRAAIRVWQEKIDELVDRLHRLKAEVHDRRLQLSNTQQG